MKILFVCSSNICRSPFCEYVFRRKCENDPDLAARVEWVQSGAVFHQCKKLHPKARTALLKEGFPEEQTDAHRPAYIRNYPERFEQADVIIGMTAWHRWFIPRKWKDKYVNLATLVTGAYKPVPDPFLESSQEGYDKVMDILKEYLDKLADLIRSDSLSRPPYPAK